jgi:hypothetical protein
MLLQSLVVIAAMLVLTASILLETLVSAKAGFHTAMLARTQTALVDATASFVTWARSRVVTYGAGNALGWPAQSAPTYDPNVCPSAAPQAGSTPAPCAFTVIDTWQIRGATATAAGPSANPQPGFADARNLAPTVNEQRLAATIDVRITDRAGRTTYAERTREVTARLFEAPPYVVITGVRDIVAEAGSIHAGEGDTGGAPAYGALGGDEYGTPNPQLPAADTDTRIRTSVDCQTESGSRGQAEFQPAEPGQIDYSFHPYGNQDWAYETPCVPIDGVPSPPPGLPGYLPPVGSLYATSPGDQSNTTWTSGNDNPTTFAR